MYWGKTLIGCEDEITFGSYKIHPEVEVLETVRSKYLPREEENDLITKAWKGQDGNV